MLDFLNPKVLSVKLVERVTVNEPTISYNAKIIYTVSGELAVSVGEDEIKYRLSPGALLFIPGAVTYKLKAKYLRAVFVDFDLTQIPNAKSGTVLLKDFVKTDIQEAYPPFDKPVFVPDMEAERDTFVKMSEAFVSCRGEYLAEASAQLKLMLIKIAELTDEDALPTSLALALDSYIRENISDEISGVEIGAVFGYHPYYVSNMLKERRGLTVKQYVNDYRMKYAKSLLAYSAMDIGDVADACGFRDQSYFAKSFKNAYGVSPKDFRSECKNKPL